jgi:putative ABC transport system substrate-binding protein
MFRIRLSEPNSKSKIQTLKWVALLGMFLAGWEGIAEGQQPKLNRIGILLPGGPLYDTVDGLRAGLKELGLEEGKHVLPTIRDTQGDAKAGEAAANQLEHEKFQLIYAIGKYVQRVLNGAAPGELRVETLDNVELTVNLRTARELGVTIPAQVLARAKKVIK